MEEEQIQALLADVREKENREVFLVGKLLATMRAQLDGKLNEREIFQELNVKLD